MSSFICYVCFERDGIVSDAVVEHRCASNQTGKHFAAFVQGRRITLHGDRLTGFDGTLAGAHLTMLEAVRNAVALIGVGIADALTMASRTPATFLGLGARPDRAL